jgi:hypothetical protein
MGMDMLEVLASSGGVAVALARLGSAADILQKGSEDSGERA